MRCWARSHSFRTIWSQRWRHYDPYKLHVLLALQHSITSQKTCN